jgi:L-ascorbate metabolism protein UlaG (beta-lactamase superfamily)
MYLTWFDSNAWLMELAGQRILLDPWLVGDLVFGENLTWLFRGYRQQAREIPANIDLILLSQGLADHAHPATLQQLDKAIPVVASPAAAKVVQELGYGQVTALAHGEKFTLNDRVTMQALPGSPVGPGTQENGYWLQELATGATLYYEPHGFHAPIVQDLAPIDVIITPLIDLALPLIGPIIKGTESALQLAQWVKPQFILPTAAGGDVMFEGLLLSLLKAVGTTDELRAKLAQAQLAAQILEPKPGDRVEIPVKSPMNAV